jgi:hypothetical protein
MDKIDMEDEYETDINKKNKLKFELNKLKEKKSTLQNQINYINKL